jgi:hypothetical protein
VPQLATNAYAIPPDASTSLTGPGVDTSLHEWPPLCVAHSCGSNAQPSDAVANRTFVIAGLEPVNAAGTSPTLFHVFPASTDAASVAQDPETQPWPHAVPLHACTPSTNPCVAETKVTEAGRKPVREAVGDALGATTGGGGVAEAAAEEGGGDMTGGADETAGDEAADDAAGETAGETGAEPVDAEWWLLEQPATTSTVAILKRAARAVREMFMTGRRSNGASGCMSIALILIGETVEFISVGVASIAKTARNGGADGAELLHLLGSERIEQMRPHTLDVSGCRGFKCREPGIRQDGELTSAVGGAQLAPHPTVLLEPGHGVRQPASRRQRPVGQRAHAQPPVGHLRQPHQDLVIGVRDSAVALELLIEPVDEQLGGLDERPPDDLLLRTEPSRLRPRHALLRQGRGGRLRLRRHAEECSHKSGR